MGGSGSGWSEERPTTTSSSRGEERPLATRIGVSLGPIGVDVAWWLESARRLDEAGYGGVWCWDHFVGKGDRTRPVLEQWTTLTAAAATTRRIGVGSFVVVRGKREETKPFVCGGCCRRRSGNRLRTQAIERG